MCDPLSIRSRSITGALGLQRGSCRIVDVVTRCEGWVTVTRACRYLTNTPYRVDVQDRLGVHWQDAGVECHLDTLGVTWVVIFTLGVLVRYPSSKSQSLSGELSAPITGFSEFGWLYPMKYFRPVYLVPLNLLEEFSKLNILADSLWLCCTVSGLVPIAVPIPVFLLGLFTSGIQALVFATLAGTYLAW